MATGPTGITPESGRGEAEPPSFASSTKQPKYRSKRPRSKSLGSTPVKQPKSWHRHRSSQAQPNHASVAVAAAFPVQQPLVQPYSDSQPNRSKPYHKKHRHHHHHHSKRPQRIVRITFIHDDEGDGRVPEEGSTADAAPTGEQEDGPRSQPGEDGFEEVDESSEASLPDDVRIPTDRLGRVKRGIDVRDFRPLAPRNTTQELMARQTLTSSLTSIDFRDEEDNEKDKDKRDGDSPKGDINLEEIQEFGSMVPLHRLVRRRLCCSWSSEDESSSSTDDGADGENYEDEGEDEDDDDLELSIEVRVSEVPAEEDEELLDYLSSTSKPAADDFESSLDRTIAELSSDPSMQGEPFERKLNYSSEGVADTQPQAQPANEETTATASSGQKSKRKRKASLSYEGSEGAGEGKAERSWSAEELYMLPMPGQRDVTSSLLLQWISEQEDTIAQLTRENKRLRRELASKNPPTAPTKRKSSISAPSSTTTPAPSTTAVSASPSPLAPPSTST